MDVSKAFRMLILVFSFLMFIWQASVALSNLMDPPVVDSTERLNFDKIDSQLLTICPLNQFNLTKLQQFGYPPSQYEFFMGFDNSFNFIGWGAHLNLTYVQMVEELQNYNLFEPLRLINMNRKKIHLDYEIRLYPRYGYCYDINNFLTNTEVRVKSMDWIFPEAHVFVTDKKLRTKIDVHIASHWGTKIILEEGWFKQYVVKTEQVSNFDPRNPDNCKVYDNDDFEKCVDDQLQMVFKPIIDCNPPWLSSKDQCDGAMNVSMETQGKLEEQFDETLYGIYDMKNYPARKRCMKPCIFTQANVLMYDTMRVEHAAITLTFADKVVYTTKKIAYGPSAFLIDMGSSLGLWFGLSVFGITDLGILAFQWVKKKKQEVLRIFMN